MVHSSSSHNDTTGLTGTTRVIRPYDLRRVHKERQLAELGARRRQLNAGNILVRGIRGKRRLERSMGVASQAKDADRLLDLELVTFAKSLAADAIFHMFASGRKTISGADVVDAAKGMGIHHLHRQPRRYRRRRAGADANDGEEEEEEEDSNE